MTQSQARGKKPAKQSNQSIDITEKHKKLIDQLALILVAYMDGLHLHYGRNS